MGARQVSMVTGIVDIPRHGPNNSRHNGNQSGGLSGAVLEKLDDIRRGLASVDPRCTGLVSEKDFKKVLYLEGGISYSEIALIIEEAPRKGGFVGYDAWIVDYLNLYQPADSSFRTQGQPTAHPGQPWEEIQRQVIEGGTHLLSSLTLLDIYSTSGTCHPDLGEANPQLLATRESKMMLPDLHGAPGVPYTDCKSEVSDYHTMATQDIREKYRQREFDYQNDRRDQALKEKSAMTLASEYGVQHTKTL